MLLLRKYLLKTVTPKYSTQPENKTKQFSNTVLLPQTKFPLRLGKQSLLERDCTINNSEEFQSFYSWQRASSKGPEFVLHDGPPYANGSLHMGHAINKILKDAILRYNIIQGYKVQYVPGWDCHGLPIELKVSAEKDVTPVQLRQKARKFARETVEQQMKTFMSWGVMGDWGNAYMTYNDSYIKNQLLQFCSLYEKELVFKDVKPVFWSPSSRTALAEAELEYVSDHKSKAATVRFLVNSMPKLGSKFDENVKTFALIWTTTPWTLPSNQAVCFNPELSYSLVQGTDEMFIYLVATELITAVSTTCNSQFKILDTFSGETLEGATYFHPLSQGKIQPFLASSHATSTKGTGLVHTAPAHGPDDFLVALKNRISPVCLVDDLGRFTADAGIELQGKFVLDEGTNQVLSILKECVLNVEDYVHSYPYDWRTKKPVILRASDQWFVDTEVLKDRAIKLLEEVQILPDASKDVYKNNLIGQLRKRPYWCISRQRSWGVPIPAFYDKETRRPIINREIIIHLNDLIDKHGPDFWWTLPVEKLIPSDALANMGYSMDEIERGNDIFDIWFDSGISWCNVLKGSQIADMYLEGVDQFTGWFQSSLLLSVALRNRAPYKNIYVHGFAVDAKGDKMSKSLGNVIDPSDITLGTKNRKPFGVDVLRWWVTCHANKDSLAPVSDSVLEASANEVQKVRSVMRFILGSLFDYQEKQMHCNSLMLTDRYLLYVLWRFNYDVLQAMRDYRFHKVGALLLNFLTNPVSALYLTTIKDRLYCDSAHSCRRRSAQYVLLQVFNGVLQIISPIVPHLAQELYEYLPQRTESSVFKREPFRTETEWKNKQVNEVMNLVLRIRGDVNKEFGATTAAVSVDVKLPMCSYEMLTEIASKESLEIELADVFQVSSVTLVQSETTQDYELTTKPTELHFCYRCRRHSSNHKEELCQRCTSIIENSYKSAVVN